jgi:solute:Na+ symporter, SSS family
MVAATNDSGLQTLDYLAIVAYLLVMLGIGYRASRRQANTDDYFLGGRRMPWFVIGLSIMATFMSTNTYLGAPGEMIKYGPAYFLGYLAYPLIALVVMGVWIPFFMRLKLTSAYDYLEYRFDHRARIVGTALFLCLRLGWISMVVYTAASAMITMTPGPSAAIASWFAGEKPIDPIYPIIVAVGVAATLYACVGGFRAVVWTDVLQAVMLFGGVGLIIGYVAVTDRSGIPTWWRGVTSVAEAPTRLVWFSADIAERTTVVWALASVFAWHACTHCCDQVALQRYFATTSLAAARRSFLVNIVGSAAIGAALGISGLALRYYYLRHENRLPDGLTPASGADQLMPTFFANELPLGCGGLILVSFLCDALQTLSAGVNSIAAAVGGDSHSKGPEAGRRGVLRARLTTLLIGAAVTTAALGAACYARAAGKTIFDMLPRVYNLFLSPLAVMFMIGMFYRRATAGVALGVVGVTLAFSTAWSWWGEVPRALDWLGLDAAAGWWTSILGSGADGRPRTPTVLLAIAAPALFGLAIGAIASKLFGRRGHKGEAYTWFGTAEAKIAGAADGRREEPPESRTPV